MFFRLVRKNSKRNRKENGIFFVSLIIAVVAFYIILTFENQDVMQFLRIMESDAVDRLLQLIPVFYGFSLFIIFFLIYFAGNYQMERRGHEFGMYLMMGMRKGKLALMLILEDLWSSVLSLVIGIPIAVLFSECISLITARLVGLGILGHQTSFSMKAVLMTAVGYLAVKFLAFVILSAKIASSEIGTLLAERQEDTERQIKRSNARAQLFIGMVCLIIAYGLAMKGNAWTSQGNMGICLLLGIIGTFLLFFGLRFGVELFIKKNSRKDVLHTFSFRQLQENVIHRPGTMAIASLLVLFAVCCFGYGVAGGWQSRDKETHNIDYTFHGYADERIGNEIKEKLTESGADDYIGDLFEVRTIMLSAYTDDGEHTFDWGNMLEILEGEKKSDAADTLANNISQTEAPYLFCVSDYNHILKAAGKEPLHLEENEAAMYSGKDFSSGENGVMLRKMLEQRPYVQLDGVSYRFVPEFYNDNIIVDRMITISYAIILPDKVFDGIFEGSNDSGFNSYWDAALKKEEVQKAGLMQTISDVNELLDKTGLEYESYLQNLGRQLFYVVAGSYITLYLAIIFLIIANTVLSVQFLMQQQKTGKRYRILVNLGSSYQMLCCSARRQIRWYFGLPVGVAVVSSVFGVKALFTGMLPSGLHEQIFTLSVIALAMILVLCVVECIYLTAVMRLSDRHIHEFMQVGPREE